MQFISKDVFTQASLSIKSLLVEFVGIESPSSNKAAVDRLGARITRELVELDGNIEIYEQEKRGNIVTARWGDGRDGILTLCHMDTVFDLGTVAQRPFREADGKLYGPGVLDMKSGIAILLSVLCLFRQNNTWPTRSLTLLFTSDEEIGSFASRELIENEARNASVVFCLEPGLPDGALKTSRKGVGEIDLSVKGVSAHAGADHEKGRNAIEEMAYHVLVAQKLTDYDKGTTVNVGLIRGGTRTNVVPETAKAMIDFRVTSKDEVSRLEEWVKGLKPVIQGVEISASFTLNRPPMPRDDRMVQTFKKAQSIVEEIRLNLNEGSTGGGSDANFVAALGIPVLDGLGGVGDGAHSEREYILSDSLAERAALQAALLLNW
ncbi:MAG TPA: M20 family metallopeptidase [Anaerolineaceae bacterium]|nr:M20 family metallopeptidase [Anaerolineaceae bacterium]